MYFDRSSEEPKTYQITCPYCFAKFNHDEVIFRAKGGSQEEKTPGGTTRGGSSAGSQKNLFGGGLVVPEDDRDDDIEVDESAEDKVDLEKLFRKFDPQDSKKAGAKLDEKLIEFWKGRGGENGYNKDDPEWNLPHIDPLSPDFEKMTVKEPGEADAFCRDKHGFIYRVVDSYTGNQKDGGMTRLCRECHNPLPGFDYGKYPVFFIAVVGLTSAGKTVFIRQMLNHIESALRTTPYTLGTHMIHMLGTRISPAVPLPASTDSETMRRPISVSIYNREDEEDGLTLVFYDIAGENCEYRDAKEGKNPKLAKKISDFLSHADAMFLLMDPKDLSVFGGADADANQDKIRDILDIVVSHRASEGLGVSWKDVPVAICVTKSDRILDRCPDLHFNEPANPNADGFDNAGTNRDIHNRMKELFNDMPIGDAFYRFDDHAYFAVSAISCGVETRIEKYGNKYSLSAEDAALFQKARRWFMDKNEDWKGWNHRNKEERKYCGTFPIRDKDGKLITFDYDQSVTEKNAQMETEIVATCPYSEIHLTLWDVLNTLQPVGYPISQPNPWRINEPLKWILWRAGYLGPKYYDILPEPPTFAEQHFPSKKREYAAYLEKVAEDNRVAKEWHYWGKIPAWAD